MKATILLIKFAMLSVLTSSLLRADVQVASTHPLLTDVLQRIGAEKVTVISTVKPGMEIHSFKPGSKDLGELEKCKLIFVMGKGLEPYLDDVRSATAGHAVILEVGEAIPSQGLSCAADVTGGCEGHSHGSVDPHWWHSPANMQRAVRFVASELARIDPENESLYQANAKVAEKQFSELQRWAKAELMKIPRENRQLVTAHAAFGYFCKEYGFTPAYVQGLSPEQEISNKQLADQIIALKQMNVKAVFPEKNTNPKTLQQIATETGAKIGEELISDGSVAKYEDMFVANVNAIVHALTK